MERLYSLEDAAQLLGGISKKTLFAWIAQGKLRKTKIGSRTMIAVSELERFVAASRGRSDVYMEQERSGGQ